jgi:hypothetical protein
LRAGADYLVHSVDDAPIDDEFLTLAKQNRVLYCPTLYVFSGYIEALSGTWQPTAAESRFADPQIVASMGDIARLPRESIPLRLSGSAVWRSQQLRVALQNLRTVWDAGITVVMGTDAGNIGTLHGPSVFREMALMQEAGLTPLQVLRAATSNGARVARREDEMGAIVPGRLADMVILDADPTATVDNLSRVYRVIKGGTVFDPDALVRSIR